MWILKCLRANRALLKASVTRIAGAVRAHTFTDTGWITFAGTIQIKFCLRLDARPPFTSNDDRMPTDCIHCSFAFTEWCFFSKQPAGSIPCTNKLHGSCKRRSKTVSLHNEKWFIANESIHSSIGRTGFTFPPFPARQTRAMNSRYRSCGSWNAIAPYKLHRIATMWNIETEKKQW